MPGAVDFLLSSQHQSGGWGYIPGQNPAVEPTSAALLALWSESRALQACQRGLEWLFNIQNQDGGWGYGAGDDESNWNTAWALIALTRMGVDNEMYLRGVEWLATVGTSSIAREQFQAASQIPEQDVPDTLCWPWLPEEAAWIEPTALAVLALNGITDFVAAPLRISAALRYFRNNRCPAGGWDIGNFNPLDTIVLARSHPTALVILALSELAVGEITSQDVEALRTDMRSDRGALAQAIGALALRTLGEEYSESEARLAALQREDSSWNRNVYHTSLALLANRGGWR